MLVKYYEILINMYVEILGQCLAHNNRYKSMSACVIFTTTTTYITTRIHAERTT